MNRTNHRAVLETIAYEIYAFNGTLGKWEFFAERDTFKLAEEFIGTNFEIGVHYQIIRRICGIVADAVKQGAVAGGES